MLFTIASVAGYAHFQLISYHFKTQAIVTDVQIPVLFALAMGIDGLVALLIGRIYDRVGFSVLISIPLFTFPIPLLVFSQSVSLVIIGVIFWGIVMGVQETIMRAAIADITPVESRGTAYGIFNAAYGLAWFLGTSLMGFLYGISLTYIFIFTVSMEALAVLFLFFVKKNK
jgi:predicted MFS family arabinose efflux permease